MIFEDVAAEKRRGKISKLLNTFSNYGNRTSNPLSGVIVYETIDGSVLGRSKNVLRIVECMWSACGVHVELIWRGCGVHVECIWSGCGVHMEWVIIFNTSVCVIVYIINQYIIF